MDDNVTTYAGRAARFCMPGFLFVIGFFAIVAQTLVIRESLATFGGNELSIAVVLTFWLLGVCVGAAVGGRLAGRAGRLPAVLCCATMLAALALAPALVAIRSMRAILAIPPGRLVGVVQMAIAALAVVTPVSFLVGFAFPVASRAYRLAGVTPVWSIGGVYVVEGAGSIVGGVVLTFVFLGRLGTFRIWYTAAALVVAGVLVLCIAIRARRRLASAVVVVSLLAAGLGVAGVPERLESASVDIRWRSTSTSEMVANRDSVYQNIAVGFDQEQHTIYSNGLVGEVFPDDYANRIAAMAVMAEHPNPRKVLMIGSGLAGLVRYLLNYPIERLDYVELDPALFDVLEEFLPDEDMAVRRDARLAAYAMDGRFFVKCAAGGGRAIERRRVIGTRAFRPCKYDMAIINLPDPATAMLDRFYTRDFYREVTRVIEPQGVLVASFTLAENYYSEELWDYAASLYQTVKAVFGHVIVSPPGAPGVASHLFASRQRGIITDDPDVLAARYEAFGVQPTELKVIYQSIWPAEKTEFVRRALEDHPKAALNTDHTPTSFFLYLRLFERFAGGRFFAVLDWLARGRLTYLAVALAILFTSRLVYVCATKRATTRHARFNAVAAVATTGFGAMALEMALIFSFQTSLGYIYRDIGLVVALFMTGLAAGGAVATRLVSRGPATASVRGASGALTASLALVVATSLGVAGVIMVLPSIESAAVVRSAFLACFAATGIAAGLEFPIASQVLLASGRRVAAAAGAVDSADHFGALVGAAAGGVVLVPLVCVVGACLVVAGANFASLVLCVLGLLALPGAPSDVGNRHQ